MHDIIWFGLCLIKVAPKKKGRTLGLGSIEDVPACSSSSQQHSAPSQAAIAAQLAAEVTEHRRFREETLARENSVMQVLEMMAGDNPVYLEAIRRKLPPRAPPAQPPTEAEVSDREATLRAEAGIPDVQLGNRDLFWFLYFVILSFMFWYKFIMFLFFRFLIKFEFSFLIFNIKLFKFLN